MKISSRQWLVGVGASFALAGCGGGSANLNLNVTFGGKSCSAAGVDTIAVTAQSPQQIYTAQAKCGAGVQVSNVAPGNFELKVQGLSNGTVTFEGSQTAQVWDFGDSSISIDLTPPEK